MKYFSEGLLVLSQPPWLNWGLWFSALLFLTLIGLRLWVYADLQRQVFSFWRNGVTYKEKNQWFILIEGKRWGGLLLIVVLGFYFFSGWGVVLAMGLGVGLIWGEHWYQQQQRSRKVKQQLPLFLRALGSTLKAGYSVPQALIFVIDEVEDPLKMCLKDGKKALNWQQPLSMVLADLQQKLDIAEFDFLADSLSLQSRKGGNLVELCHRMAGLLEDRLKLERDLKAFTAQGKMSGLLMATLWPVSLVLFAWLAPSHTDVLFYTPIGKVLLGLSLCLELIGFWFIWRLVRISV